MLKVPVIVLLLICLLFGNTFSQKLNSDSLNKIAVADAKLFKMDEGNLKKFKQHRSNSSSDLFKPSNSNVSNPSLLNDSVYVKAFRKAAYKNTKKANSTSNHKKAGILGYVAAIGFIGLVFIGLNKM